jgi:hypothetical protein
MVRALYDCPAVSVGPDGVQRRVVVATHPADEKKSPVGVTRAGVVYELFFSRLPQQAFTASDVVALYLHRGALETTLADLRPGTRSRPMGQPYGHGSRGMATDQPMGVESASGTGPSAPS